MLNGQTVVSAMLDLQPIAGNFSVATFAATTLPCENGHTISRTKRRKIFLLDLFWSIKANHRNAGTEKSPSSSKLVFPLAPPLTKGFSWLERCSASAISLIRRHSPHPRPHSARCDHPSHFSYVELVMRCKRDLLRLAAALPGAKARSRGWGTGFFFHTCQSFWNFVIAKQMPAN